MISPNYRPARRRGLLVALLVLVCGCGGLASACAVVYRQDGHMVLSQEEAVIIWEGKAKREHFIRRAAFSGSDADFGFLVPTPTIPELAEADAALFKDLHERLRPQIMPLGTRYFPRGPGPVQVLFTQRVGRFDATVLAATDVGALNQWLQEKGFAAGAAYEAWLAPYVKANWIITAFKITRVPATPAPLATAAAGENQKVPITELAAVRLSFTTDRPLYPYRQPATPDQKEVLGDIVPLTVSVLSDEFVQVAVGEGDTLHRLRLATVRRGLMPLTPTERAAMAAWMKLTPPQMPQKVFATVFRDYRSSRPGSDDIAFVRDNAAMERVAQTAEERWIAVDDVGRKRRDIANLRDELAFERALCTPPVNHERAAVEALWGAGEPFGLTTKQQKQQKQQVSGLTYRSYRLTETYVLNVCYDAKARVEWAQYDGAATIEGVWNKLSLDEQHRLLSKLLVTLRQISYEFQNRFRLQYHAPSPILS